MNIKLTDEEWRRIDRWIFRGWTINAIKSIGEITGVGIREAMDIVEERACLLRTCRFEEFIAERRFDDYKNVYFYA